LASKAADEAERMTFDLHFEQYKNLRRELVGLVKTYEIMDQMVKGYGVMTQDTGRDRDQPTDPNGLQAQLRSLRIQIYVALQRLEAQKEVLSELAEPYLRGQLKS